MSAKNKKFYTEFLELYESLPCLWKVKSDEYCNRVLRANAYQVMVKKLKEIEPDADREMVVKKINIFRSNFRRDLKKIKNSQKSGAGAEEIFESSLWYFDLLLFLEEQEEYKEERSIIIESSNIKNENLPLENQQPMENQEQFPENIKRFKRKNCKEDNLLKLACDRLTDSTNEGAVLAKSWALQYSELAQRQKLFVRKTFSDILFQAGLERLTENTVRSIQNILDPPTPLWSDTNSTFKQPIIETNEMIEQVAESELNTRRPTIKKAKDFHNFDEFKDI